MAIKKRKLYTLCIIHEHPRVLLGMKKVGLGTGHWNGFGGKVEEGEDIEEAALRELKEEAGVGVSYIEKYGILEFEFVSEPEKLLEVHVFKCAGVMGDPKESDEMKPQWFDVMDIPFRDMWSDDPYWMPLLLKDKKFMGKFVFDKPSSADTKGRIVERHLEVVREV